MELYIILLFTFIPAISGRNPINAEGRIRRYLLDQPGFSSHDRPVLSSNDTVQVKLDITLYALCDVNEKDQIISVAVWTDLTWKDQRLVWDHNSFEGVTYIHVPFEEIWTPRIILSNSVSLESLELVSPGRGFITLTSDGKVSLSAPFIQSTKCQMNVRYFPYDTQRCPFHYVPFEERSRLNFSMSRNEPYQDFVSTEWELVEATKYENLIGNVSGSYYRYGIFEVVIRRDPHYYITALVIPSTFLCLLSFVAFLAPPDSGERVSLGVSMVLGLTVFQLLVSDTLPTASKQPPILNGYLSSTFFLASLVVPFSLFNVNIAHGDVKLTKILKYPILRRMLLETLPSLFFVPNYLDRINVRMTHQKKPQGDIIDEGIRTKAPVVKTSLSGKVDPEDKCYVGEKLTMSEKVKLEARTVGLVMDRIFLLCFLIAFGVVLVVTLAEFASLYGDD